MLSAVKAIHAEVKAALNPLPGGYYRVEDSNGDAVVPSWWLHADGSSSLGLNEAETITLDIWHRNLGDLQAALDQVSFLWRWREYLVADFPGATYENSSTTILYEDGGVVHASLALTAITWDGDLLKRP